jgi:pimeloyl-ACP methyl ester carboxylesterase
MLELPTHHVAGRDGARLAYRELGEGRPLVLLHGLFSTGPVNWVRYGHVEALAAAGHRVIVPDLRAHGASAAPHDPAAYPPDVLADDGLALVEALGLSDYDLGGYSLGGRTVLRMLVRGARPRRAVVAGMGLDAVAATAAGNERYRRVLTGLGTFERGSPDWMAEAFMRSNGGDPEALLLLLASSVDTSPVELSMVETPTLVVVGAEDGDHASAERLAEVLPRARFELVPGNHMSAVTKPELAETIGAFLAEPEPA